MRLLALMAMTLTGCASMHGPLDVITPDEFTLGQGSASINTTGGYQGHQHMYDYEGEEESTYAALTWDIPTWEGKEGGMNRETQRNLALLIDRMAEEEMPDDEEGPMFKLADGAKPPPAWLPFALGGIGLAIVLGFALRSRRRDER